MRKPTSVLETQLSEMQQAQLADWLLSGLKYHEAPALIEKEFGLRHNVKSASQQLSKFWQAVCQPSLIARRSRARSTAAEIAGEAEARPAMFDRATIDALEQKSFELAISPGANPKDVKQLFSLVLKAREQSLDERKVAILERKARIAEEAEKAVSDSNLTAKEKEQRLKQIFGIGG